MIHTFVRRTLSEITGLSEESFSPDAPLYGPGGISTLQLAQLIVLCERAYHIAIGDETILDFDTLHDFTEAVEKLVEDGREDYSAPSEENRLAWFYE